MSFVYDLLLCEYCIKTDAHVSFPSSSQCCFPLFQYYTIFFLIFIIFKLYIFVQYFLIILYTTLFFIINKNTDYNIIHVTYEAAVKRHSF